MPCATAGRPRSVQFFTLAPRIRLVHFIKRTSYEYTRIHPGAVPIRYGASLCRGVPGALGPPRARLRAEQICPAHTTSCLAPASCTQPHTTRRRTAYGLLCSLSHTGSGKHTHVSSRPAARRRVRDVKQTRAWRYTRGPLHLRTIAAIDV